MTPKEKAEEIFNKMYQVYDIMGNYPMCFDTAKQCALIAVDEILKQLSPLDLSQLGTYTNPKIEYWLDVKNEIEKL